MSSGKVAVQTLRYHHLAVAVTNLATSKAFYEKVGFQKVSEGPSSVVMANHGGKGLQLHLLLTKLAHPNNKNQLMDLGDKGEKYPGHTHMSFGVRSVAATRRYLEGCGLTISGTRGTLAVFIRDPDGTTLEFERNDGKDEDVVVDVRIIGQPPRGGIDHIGTRVTQPHRAEKWYGETLGFTKITRKYEPDEANPRSNNRPFILRTEHGQGSGEIDENLIINGTTTGTNILLSGEEPYPGIIYAGLEVAGSAEDAVAALTSAVGEENVAAEAAATEWGIPGSFVLPCEGASSLFLRDPDRNVFRLVTRA